jgi:hypothetical protein
LTSGRKVAFAPAGLFGASDAGAWYDPSDLTSMFQDSAGTTPVTAAGQPMGRLLDKSGRGNHVIQGTSASRPLLQQDASGFWHGLLDGFDDSWATAAALNLSGTQRVTVIAGVRKLSDGAVGCIAEHNATTTLGTPGSFILHNQTAPAGYRFAMASAAAVQTDDMSAYVAPHSAVISGVLDMSVAASTITPLVNGLAPTETKALTAGVQSFANATFFVGRRGGTSLPFNGRLYQLIVVGRALTASEIAAASRYVASKAGVVL